LERHGWAVGYADAYIDGLEEAWARINDEIERGLLPKGNNAEGRNGLVLAANLLLSLAGEVCVPRELLWNLRSFPTRKPRSKFAGAKESQRI